MIKGQLKLDFEAKHAGPLLSPDEIFEQCDEQMLRKLFEYEDSRLEKKPAGIQPRALSEYFVMWANTQPSGGVIVVGITKDKVFEGCATLHPNQLNELEKTAYIYCPDAGYDLKRVKILRDNDKQSDYVLVFRVRYHESKVVRSTDGRVFVRSGDSKIEVKGDAIRHLQAEKGEVHFELEPCNLRYPDDFNAAAVAEFAETVREDKGWDQSHSKEHILEILRLGKLEGQDFVPNVACALLFASNPRDVVPGCRIRFLRFSGETEGTGDTWNAVKDEYIEGSVPTQIQKTAEILSSQLRNFSKLGKDGKFLPSPEYPEFAWYEAVVNACVHRSYGNGMKNMPIFVKMFDDRLVVISPGPFPAFVTPKNIYNCHNPRNIRLMDAMFHLKFVKAAAEGTKRMRAKMLEMDLPEPLFEQDVQDHATVRVTLRNNFKQRKAWVDSDVVEILGAQIAQSLSENEKRCINFVAEYGKIGVSDAQRLTGLHWGGASKLLKGLAEMKIFEYHHRTDLLRDPKARYMLRVH